MQTEEHTELPRISKKELLVLEMLIGQGEMFGLQMVDASGGDLKRGTVYVTLQRMEDKGYIASREEPREHPEIGIARRNYRATGLGEKVFKTNQKALQFFNSTHAWGEV